MTAIRFIADRMWDGTGPLRGRSAVDALDGMILDVGSVAQLPPPPAALVVRDLGDVTLLPGLVDTHVHVTFSCGDDVVGDFERDKQLDGGDPLLARARHNLGVALDAGITTVRDLGTPAPLATNVRRDLAEGTMRGPSFMTSASPLTTPGGHCHFLSHEVGPQEDPAAAVDRAIDAGADLIKVFASGGNLTPGSSPLARQSTARHWRPSSVPRIAVAGSSQRTPSAWTPSWTAPPWGVDTIEHCAFMTPAGPAPDADAVARMLGDGITAVPTLGSGPPPPGTFDPATFGAPHGLGMSTTEALATATAVAARACGLEDRGALRRGLRADLLAVHGNLWSTSTHCATRRPSSRRASS